MSKKVIRFLPKLAKTCQKQAKNLSKTSKILVKKRAKINENYVKNGTESTGFLSRKTRNINMKPR